MAAYDEACKIFCGAHHEQDPRQHLASSSFVQGEVLCYRIVMWCIFIYPPCTTTSTKNNQTEWFEVAQGLRQGCLLLSPLLFNGFFAAVLLVAQEISSEDADIHVDLIHLKEKPSEVGPETALGCVRRAIWGMMLYADDACMVSRSPRGLERMMVVFVEIFGVFSLAISESKTEAMCMPVPCALAMQRVLNTPGLQYRQTTSFTYLGGTVTETPNLSDEIFRWICASWMSFRRYTRKLCDHPKASLQHLKA